MGLEASLRQLGRDIGRRFDVVVKVAIAPGTFRLSPSARAVEIYRIAQEALTNAARHAKTNEIRLVLCFEGDTICVTIEDDGVGFSLSTVRGGAGLGLVSMRERAAAAGGRLRLVTKPGEGTRVHLSVPFSRDEPTE